MRKRTPKEKMSWLRPLSGFLCLPVLYFAANATLPYAAPILSSAAILSAEMSYFPRGEPAQAYDGALSGKDDEVLASADNTPLVPADEFLIEKGAETEDRSESSLESASEAASQTETQTKPTPEKPEDAGVIQRQTYSVGSTGSYVSTGKGYIKNCTSHTTQEITDVAEQLPAFAIQANGQPEVLIMHTHATESYQEQALDWYDKAYTCRTTDLFKNTCRVGDEIKKQLEAVGIGVLHDKTLHDYPSYNGAYERSAETVKQYLAKYPTIKVVLDVHRDAIQPDSNTMVAPVTTIKGKSCAQVMIISGCDDGTMNMPNYMENLKLSAALQRNMEADYPTLARPVLFDYRKYNQDLTTGSILLEMGGHANTLEEAIYCGELVGKSLAKTLLELKK